MKSRAEIEYNQFLLSLYKPQLPVNFKALDRQFKADYAEEVKAGIANGSISRIIGNLLLAD